MLSSLFPLFFISLLFAGAEVDFEDDEVEDAESDADIELDEEEKGMDASDMRTVSTVYVIEHCFLAGDAPKWLPRGALLLSGKPDRGFEARLSDAKEFVQLRPELQQLMEKAAIGNRYYATRMYSPENPKRVLQTSIPAQLLAEGFDDWHDILEVSMSSTGVPASLSYRVKHILGLTLFDHTQVHVTEPFISEGPRVTPSAHAKVISPDGQTTSPEQPPQQQSFLRKYWLWIVVLLGYLYLTSDRDDKGKKGGGGAAAGARRAS